MDQFNGRLNEGVRVQLDHSDKGRRAVAMVNSYLDKIADCKSPNDVKPVLEEALAKLEGHYPWGDRNYIMLANELNLAAHHTVQRLYFNHRIRLETFDYEQDELDELAGMLDKIKLEEAATVFRDAVIKMEATADRAKIMSIYDQAMDLMARLYWNEDDQRDLAVWRSLLALRRKKSLDSIS